MEDAKKSIACFEIEREAFDRYFEIEDWEIRKKILFAYYNYVVVQVNMRAGFGHGEKNESVEFQKRLIKQTDRAIAVYDDPKVRALDGDKYDLDGLKEELEYDVYGNWICGTDEREDLSEDMFCRSQDGIEKLYNNVVKENENPLEMEDEIYCNYWRGMYFAGKVELREYVEKMIEYFDYVLEHSDLDDAEQYVDGKLYQIHMFQMPTLASVKELNEAPELKKRYIFLKVLNLLLFFTINMLGKNQSEILWLQNCKTYDIILDCIKLFMLTQQKGVDFTGKDLKGRELGVGICQRKDGLYTAGFVSKRTGKSVQRYFPKLQECRNWYADARFEDEHGGINACGDMTVKAWFEYWIENIKGDSIRPNTITNYRESLKNCVVICVVKNNRKAKIPTNQGFSDRYKIK